MKNISPRNRADRGKRIARPTIGAEKSSEDQPPKFSFQYLQKKYCFSKCQKDEKLAFANTMYKLSQFKWGQLRLEPRHGLGYERIPKAVIKGSIPDKFRGEVDFIAFRFSGQKPMVGYKSPDGTFYIIWFDRDFTLYDHGS